ncbi:putative 2-oxoglutarate-dependent dioxygenase AOP1.2 [Nicotiana tabacum]|uniref:2-oxoglutarate-dependent dioxygenase AOP1.2 n=1 Tax=Nicotiana tabacum TaxID=4097 RepID=A0A1S3XFE5_TOBAC
MESQRVIPVIRFSQENMSPSSSCWISTCQDVKKAFEIYGCFLAIYEEISMEQCKELFRELEKLFDLPVETKAKNTSKIPNFGYIGPESYTRPLYESMGIENSTNLESVQSFTNLMWPSGNTHFCGLLHSHAKQMLELDNMVTRTMFASYDVEKYHETCVKSKGNLVRVMKYGVPKSDEPNVGLPPHSDKGFTTILHQNQVNGLEIETKDGHWISVEFPPSSFIVIAGDALKEWSNDRIHAVTHRVTMSGNESRYSLGQFSHPQKIGTLEELIVSSSAV